MPIDPGVENSLITSLFEDALAKSQAMRLGFINSMLGCFALYFLVMFTHVEGRDAIHIVTTIGLASTLIAFAALERRALRDG